MPAPTWKEKYRGKADFWSLVDFQQVAARELAHLGIERPSPNAQPFELKERLVRYYTSEGAVDRPEREGKEARYGYTHLIQLLVTRVLINDGWPLSKIAAFVRSNDLHALEAMLPDRSPTPAENEIESIKTTMRKSMSPPPASRQVVMQQHSDAHMAPMSAETEMLSQQSDMSLKRSLFAKAIDTLRSDVNSPAWKETLEIDLTSWCRVIVDTDEFRKAPPRAFETVGQALTHALRERRTQGRERK